MMIKKCETCGIRYKHGDCFLEYANFKDDLIEIKDLRKEITEFKESFEFTENELHGKIKKLEKKHKNR